MNFSQLSDPTSIAILCFGLFLGGVLKGATGAGLPIIAIPFIASVFDIRVAVVVLVVPNFFINLWQMFKFRSSNTQPELSRNFAFAGFLGAGIGTVLLAFLPVTVLGLLAAVTVLAYVVLRIAKPTFKLSLAVAKRFVYPVGIVAGSLQGALGLSSPLSITFMHSIKLERETFIYSISVFFAVLSLMQLPVQLWFGLSTVKLALLSTLALIPMLIGLYVGDYFGKRMKPALFDATILCLLVIVALKLIFDAFTF